MTSFILRVFAASDFSQKKPLYFFGSGPFWAQFWNLWCNNSSKPCLIERELWSELVLIVLQMPFKAFVRTEFLTLTALTQILSFWSNFYRNLPSKDGRNQKELSDYPNQSKSRPYILLVFNENYN